MPIADHLRRPASSAAWIAACRLSCSVRRGRPCRPAEIGARRQCGPWRCRITVTSCSAQRLCGRALADRAWALCRSWMPEPVRTSITSGPRDGIGDEVGQVLGDAAVGVEPWVEDRDLHAACSVTGEEAAEDLWGLLPGKAAGVAVVHGWHQGVIENVDVEMYPESFKVRLGRRRAWHPRHWRHRGRPPRSPADSGSRSPGRARRHMAARRYAPRPGGRGALEARPPQRVRSVFQPARAKPERRRHLNDLRNHRPSRWLAAQPGNSIGPMPTNTSPGPGLPGWVRPPR
jgi:hypothetical protein